MEIKVYHYKEKELAVYTDPLRRSQAIRRCLQTGFAGGSDANGGMMITMEKKYWVPALERANAVLRLVAAEPSKLKLAELTKRLGISKSTMFSLLHTMEAQDWLTRETNDTYSLGLHFGIMGNAYFQQYDLVGIFRKEAESSMRRLGESIQLARLEGLDVLYLAKVDATVPVQMVSGPGVRFPAHATGLGKMLLSGRERGELDRLFPDKSLTKLTDHTIGNKRELHKELDRIRREGYATDMQEGVMGFCCAAAPVYHPNGSMIAAISCSMPIHHWEGKREAAIREIGLLARRLSFGKADGADKTKD